MRYYIPNKSLQWRHNKHHGALNHQQLDCLFNRSLMVTSKKHQSPCYWPSVSGIHRWPMDSPDKGPVTSKAFQWCHILCEFVDIVCAQPFEASVIRLKAYSIESYSFICCNAQCYVWHDLKSILLHSMYVLLLTALRWRHNGRDSVSNHQPLFTQPYIQMQITDNIKAPRHWPLCGEFIGDRWIPRTNGQ